MTLTDKRIAKIERMMELLVQSTDEQVDITEAARITGRSVKTLRRLCASRTIAFYQEGPNKNIYFTRRELAEHFGQHRIPTEREVMIQAANHTGEPRRNRSRA